MLLGRNLKGDVERHRGSCGYQPQVLWSGPQSQGWFGAQTDGTAVQTGAVPFHPQYITFFCDIFILAIHFWFILSSVLYLCFEMFSPPFPGCLWLPRALHHPPGISLAVRMVGKTRRKHCHCEQDRSWICAENPIWINFPFSLLWLLQKQVGSLDGFSTCVTETETKGERRGEGTSPAGEGGNSREQEDVSCARSEITGNSATKAELSCSFR